MAAGELVVARDTKRQIKLVPSALGQATLAPRAALAAVRARGRTHRNLFPAPAHGEQLIVLAIRAGGQPFKGPARDGGERIRRTRHHGAAVGFAIAVQGATCRFDTELQTQGGARRFLHASHQGLALGQKARGRPIAANTFQRIAS